MGLYFMPRYDSEVNEYIPFTHYVTFVFGVHQPSGAASNVLQQNPDTT
jgi:hypothetical protein